VHRAFYKLSLVCPACKTPTQVPDKFCPECGAALTSDDDE
jgi:rRNA maturation endonuclease Nob1